MDELKAGDKVAYGNFAGTFMQILGDKRCIILLGKPMQDGTPTIIAPINEVELVKAKAKPALRKKKATPKKSK